MRTLLVYTIAIISLHPVIARAQDDTSTHATVIDEVTVDGEYPGPAMWKAARSEDASGHVMWIVGDLELLPRKVKWKSKEIEKTVREADELLLMPTASMQLDGEMGIRTGLSLLRTAFEARKNPDNATLRDVVSPDAYQRWRTLKKSYLSRNRRVERWRPIFAGQKLQQKAIDRLRLRTPGVIVDAVSKIAEEHGIKTTRPTLEILVSPEELQSTLQQFSQENLADAECFETSLSLTAAISDSARMRARAMAWATADLLALSRLDDLPDPSLPCFQAALASTAAQQFLSADLADRFSEVWLEQAEESLSRNRSTVSVLPLSQILQPHGLVAMLQARGYEITRTGTP